MQNNDTLSKMEKLQSVLDSEKKKKDEDDANLLAEAFKALAEADKQGTYTVRRSI